MATKRDIYQLKVTLEGTDPPIWRRLLTPPFITLAMLHEVLQTAMGWNDSHLHEFRFGVRRFGRLATEDRLMGLPAVQSERGVRLSSLLSRTGSKAEYTYDFGDAWEHSILLEKQVLCGSGTYPVCTGGELAAPPEECGGIHGYYEFLAAMADGGHPRHEELREWYGGDFDPEFFSVDEVNRKLTFAMQQRRDKKLRKGSRAGLIDQTRGKSVKRLNPPHSGQ